MAPRGSKRAAPKAPAEEPGAKRVADFLKAQGVSKASLQPVVEAVQHPLAELSEATRSMIIAALPWSLSVPADQRKEAQQAVVQMADEVLARVQTRLEEALASETSAAEELIAAQSKSVVQAQQAEVSANEASQAVDASKERLSQAESAQAAKTSDLQEAEDAEQRVAAEFTTIRSSMADFEDVLTNSFVKLRDASFEDNEAEGLIEKVMAMGKACTLEESLLATLPACLAKRERGAFDKQVLEQAEKVLRQKVMSLGEAATASEAKLVACKTCTEVAKADHTAAGVTHTEVAEQLRNAEAASITASAAAAESRQATSDLQARVLDAQALVEYSREALEGFKTYNVFMFEMLRDATSKKVEVVAEEVATETMEQSAEAQPAEEVALDNKAVSEAPFSKIQEQTHTEMARAVAVLGA